MTTMSQPVPRWVAGDVDRGSGEIETAGRLLVALIAIVWLASFAIGFQAALTILTLVGFGGAILGVLRPQLGLLAIGLLCTLDAPTRVLLMTGGLWRWNTFNYWLLVVLVLFLPLVLRWRGGTIRVLQALLALLALGLVISPDAVAGVQHILSITAVLALMVYFSRASPGAATLYWFALVCGVASVLGSFAFLVQQATLPYVNANALVYLPLTGLFAICLAFPWLADRRGRQTLLALLAAADLAAVFLSHSRGGMLIAAGCAIFVLVTQRGLRTRVTALVAASVLTVAASVQFTELQAIATNRVRKLLDPNASLRERTSGRSVILLGGWYIFTEHPWVGVGTGGFSEASIGLPLYEGATTFRPEGRAAHAGWIKVLAENGIPGGALLLGYVLSFTLSGWRTRDRELRRLGVLTTAVLGLAFVTTEFQSKGLWLLAAGTAVLLQRGVARDGAGTGPNT